MATTLTVKEPAIGQNPANLIVQIEENTDGVVTSHQFAADASTLTTAYVREAMKDRLAQISAAKARKAEWDALVGTTVTVKDRDADPPELVTFRLNWRRLQRLLSLQSTTPAVITRITQIRNAVEAALTANPEWLDDARI